jgi:hypothetical protein
VAFVVRDLPGLCAACRDDTLPLVKVLHHARRRTARTSALLGVLNAEECQLLRLCLLEILEVCRPLAIRRGVPADWVLTMLPDLATALSSDPAPAAGRPAVRQGD